MEPLLDGEVVRTVHFWMSDFGYADWSLNSFRLEPNSGILSCVPAPQRPWLSLSAGGSGEVHGVNNSLLFLTAVLSDVN